MWESWYRNNFSSTLLSFFVSDFVSALRVIPSYFVAFWWFFSYSFVLYFLLFFQRCPILFTQYLKAQAASYACMEAWGEGNRRVYALLHITSSWVQNQVSSLLSSSSSSEKHSPLRRAWEAQFDSQTSYRAGVQPSAICCLGLSYLIM